MGTICSMTLVTVDGRVWRFFVLSCPSFCRSQDTVSIGERRGDKVDVVNFVGSDGLVDRSPKLRECPALHFHPRKLGPTTPRGLNGDVRLNQKNSGLCSLKSERAGYATNLVTDNLRPPGFQSLKVFGNFLGRGPSPCLEVPVAQHRSARRAYLVARERFLAIKALLNHLHEHQTTVGSGPIHSPIPTRHLLNVVTKRPASEYERNRGLVRNAWMLQGISDQPLGDLIPRGWVGANLHGSGCFSEQCHWEGKSSQSAVLVS